MSIRADIQRLLRSGVLMADILVNVDDDRWGTSCAVSRTLAKELVAEWRRDGNDDGARTSDLLSAEDWLQDRRATAP
jgi:hypothetical protein